MSGARTLQVLLVLGGMLAWAVQFTVLYGVTSTLCGRGWADATLFGMGVVPFTSVMSTLAALTAAAILLIVSLREDRRMREKAASDTDRFLSHAGVLINALSLIAILWNGVPAFILPACA